MPLPASSTILRNQGGSVCTFLTEVPMSVNQMFSNWNGAVPVDGVTDLQIAQAHSTATSKITDGVKAGYCQQVKRDLFRRFFTLEEGNDAYVPPSGKRVGGASGLINFTVDNERGFSLFKHDTLLLDYDETKKEASYPSPLAAFQAQFCVPTGSTSVDIPKESLSLWVR